MLGESLPFLERSVHYNALSAQSITVLVEKAEAAGMESLLAINKEALELEKSDALHDDEPRHRMTFGIYFYHEPVDPDHPANSDQ